ncbi:TPR-like protein [Parathielavia appendiculata]|uniref:TPR-like protein n=1 Tax=Parathielavia appendiculata TaxID=2587402 RepID=A0AAN6Z4L3_9PEZI|nr:TPR-like protein [Parathielavia appendiculata]
MSGTKALLKAVNEAIKLQKWDEAIEAAEDVFQKDPKNYHAHIFLAFALDKKNQVDEAESTYLAATRLKPADPQAWQGLIKLYQRQRGRKLKQYQHAALKLAEIFRDANEMYKCQDVVDKFIDHARTQGDRAQYVDALDLILPESPIYPALEGRVPHPAKTYEIQAQIVETDEKKRINTLIGERRTRIGARVSEVTVEVKREVYSQSRLGYIYGQLINWVTDDDVRRTYEEKLLQYCYERLVAWPPGEQKEREAANVRKLANDMVIIRHPFKFAWDLAINWQDHKDIKDWDVTVLRQYCSFFPDSDLNRVIMAFLTSDISPFPKEPTHQPAAAASAESEDESEDDEAGGAPTTYVPLTEEDRLLMIMEGVSSADSLLALRLAGEYYQHVEEHESKVELMRKAFDYLKLERSRTGLSFQNTEDAFSLYLATSLVYYQSPRHHQEAKSLFDGVLAHDPSSTTALIGVGLIYEEEEEYSEAIDFLERALQRDPDNLRVRTEAAWVKALRGNFEAARNELQSCLPLLTKKGQVNKELLAQTQYRVGYCIWNLDTSKAARKSRSGAYSCFLEALKSNLNYAPAYTSLGKYYADYAKDKKRARRCFQKAVELSPSEVESAERLARSFADDGDWDRVELVAQRVVDSGKVKPPPGSKRKGISWPFAALGVAELNKQDYRKAIVSFQAALRISPDDYHSWVGLGESYHGSGRYIAATKAILNAQKLESSADANVPGETWFSKFILADIKRELGEFDESISLYREVVASRPDEAGVAIALMQATVDSALDSLDKGFFGKSVDLAVETIKFAVQAPAAIKETFNFWKAVADACSLFSSVQGRLAEFPADLVQELLGDPSGSEEIMDRDGVGVRTNGANSAEGKIGAELARVLHATILAHKRAIQLSANDLHAQAVAYYNLGWAEHRAHMCLPMKLRKKATKYLKASIACFKRAIEFEAGNAEFWNALGVVTSTVNPSVSQHSFVRSLHLNEASAHTWTNLGTLALLQGDIQFANDAFTKAQSADPDYAHAWLGQGLVALLLGDRKEARSLFTHAMDISESSSLASRRHFAVSMFDYIIESPSDVPVTHLIQPILALSHLQSLNPQELAYGHLAALFQERTHEHTRAVATLERICAAVEADYEVTESPDSLTRFAIAKADLARAHLAAGSFRDAIEAAELAIQLSSSSSGDDDDDQSEGKESESELTAEERRRVRLGAHVTLGLARYYLREVDDAVACFEDALRESHAEANPDVACVLAQVLWATGREEARERAREVLWGVIETAPHHVQAVLLLGAVALLDEDEEGLEAVVAELQSLRASDEGVTAEDQRKLGEVLRAVAAFGKGGDVEEAKANQARADVMFHPHLPHGWAELAGMGGEEGKSAAGMALRVAVKGVAPRGDLGAEDLATAYAGTGRAMDAQTAVMVAPWEKAGWQALGELVNG